MYQTILEWKNYRYLKLAVIAAIASIALYLSQGVESGQPPNGGTWQGYILGTVGALLIVWLSLLGIRKRRYHSTSGTVQGWTSAHVYLGAILLLIATLHCAVQFGWNVHTLAYGLMCIVVFSGIYGIYAYSSLPAKVISNRQNLSQKDWQEKLLALDKQIIAVANGCDADVQNLVLSALEQTRYGGTVWTQLTAGDGSKIVVPPPFGSGKRVSNTNQDEIIDQLAKRIPRANKQAEALVLNQLLVAFGRRQFVLQTLRRDIQMQAELQIWLYCHIPLTIALLAALVVHIITVFIYW
jgi:hypothetical protein